MSLKKSDQNQRNITAISGIDMYMILKMINQWHIEFGIYLIFE